MIPTETPSTSPNALTPAPTVRALAAQIRNTASGNMVGTSGVDSLQGTAGNDRMFGLAGDDSLSGLAGADYLAGGLGNDYITGASGSSGISVAGDGPDTLTGDDGDDVLRGNAGDDLMLGGTGDDNLRGDAGNDTLHGGEGRDHVSYRFDEANRTTGIRFDLSGVPIGSDVAYQQSDGLGGLDTLLDIESFLFTGTPFSDTYLGSAGEDQVDLDGGDNVASTGQGDDVVIGGSGADSVDAGPGRDDVSLGGGNDTAVGGDGGDVLDGSDGDDVLRGGAGADVLYGGAGANTLDGGEGFDFVGYDFSEITAPIQFTSTILTGRQVKPTAGVDTLIQLEGLYVRGGSGADILIGGAELNLIGGGEGHDTLTGGGGQDAFLVETFSSAPSGNDLITDFASNSDSIQFDGEVRIKTLIRATPETAAPGRLTDDQLLIVTYADKTIIHFSLDRVAGSDSSITLNGSFDPAGFQLHITERGTFATFDPDTLGQRLVTYGEVVLTHLARANSAPVLGVLSPATEGLKTGNPFSLRTTAISDADGQVLDATLLLNNAVLLNLGDDDLSAPGIQIKGLYAHELNSMLSDALFAVADVGDASVVVQVRDGMALTEQTIRLSATHNTISGAAGADALEGTMGRDSLAGLSGDDTLAGNQGQDTLFGAQGNDQLIGGAGLDTAVYSQAASRYALSFAGGALQVRDKTGSEGQDTLRSVERLQFTDRTVITESRDHAGFGDIPSNMYQFFILAFGAAPGVEYLQQTADAYRAGADVKRITNVFTSKSEFTNTYPTSLTPTALATRLIENVVGTSATAAAKAEAVQDIVTAMNNGLGVGDMIFAVFTNLAGLRGDAKWGGTAQLFYNQIAVAQYYTEVMNQSTTDVATLRAALSAVTPLSDVSTDAAIVALIGQGLFGG